MSSLERSIADRFRSAMEDQTVSEVNSHVVLPEVEIKWNNPLAVMTYAKSTKAVVIDKDEVGLFRQTTIDLPFNQNFDAVEGRVRRLDNFEELEVRQVQLSRGIPVAHKSITGKDNISFRYFYDTTDGNKSDLVEGIDILDFLTGNGGGILVFEGQEKPQDLAVTFDKADESKGTVLFFHPDYSQAGLDSFAGFEAFFRSLNIEISALIGDPGIQEYLREFDKEILEGDTYHKLTAVLEVFRARVVASLYLYDQTKDKRYLQFPLSHFKNGKIDLFDINNSNPQKALNEILWRDQLIEPPLRSRKQVKPVFMELAKYDHEFMSKLNSGFAKRIRSTISKPHLVGSHEVMAAYLTKIFELAKSKDEKAVEDAEVLLDELRYSVLSEKPFYYKIGKKKIQIKKDQYQIDSYYKEKGSFNKILDDLAGKIIEIQNARKHAQILEALDD